LNYFDEIVIKAERLCRDLRKDRIRSLADLGAGRQHLLSPALLQRGHRSGADRPDDRLRAQANGRSARGYQEGRYRGEQLVYGEAEFRGPLLHNGLLGMVAFTTVTTASNKTTGEKLFDAAAPSAGAGLRLLLNKRSRTNLCFDFAWGKDGSTGVYLAIQDAF
jgi:hypothetical protein